MQIWLFFIAGAGGDGLANLLEHSSTVTPIDYDDKQFWRVHHVVDGMPKFWAPSPDATNCFRRNQPFKTSNNQLSTQYIELINSGTNTVVTSHDVNLTAFDASDCKNIFEQNQIKVLLKASDPIHTLQLGARKNLTPWKHLNKNLQYNIDETRFDAVINYETITENYSSFVNWSRQLNIDVTESDFNNFCQIRAGDKNLICPGVLWYQSNKDQTFTNITGA